MRGFRPILILFALVSLLMLGACGSTVQEKAELHTVHADYANTPIPDVPAARPENRAEYPINLFFPVRLVIPAIGINAFVEKVGIRPDGDLATPTQNPWDNVGWYELGPHPGEHGSAVIDGHLDRPGGYPAVFWRLRDIRVGDDIQVTNSNGKTLHFRVSRIAYYTPDQAPIQDIFGNLGGTYLNLITCAGDWIPDQHQTTLRQVVYTTFV